MAPSGLEEVGRSFDIDALIKRRLEQARTDAGAGGEADPLVDPGAAEQLVQAAAISEVPLNEGQCLRRSLQVAQVGLFDFRIVKVIEIIEDPDRVALAQKPLANMPADE